MVGMVYYRDNHITQYCMDFRENDLPHESVQVVCTSPPYWGLRRYSGEQDLIWVGDGHCEHQFDTPTMATLGFNTLFRPEGETSTPLGLPSDMGKYAETVKGGADRQQVKQVGHFCSLCGAWKGAYGLEPTPEMYVEHTIEILREIRRVLRKDGVVFWNIGDSYSSGGRRTNKPQTVAGGSEQGLPLDYSPSRDMLEHPIIKPKDLCLIPFRVAIAAQEDGWVIRSIIIWSKPNPMPESVRDRPTESHEYIIMMTKAKQIGKLPLAISDNNRHWLAGVVDGEGCIRVAKFHNSYGAQILIGGMHKEFIERVRDIVGVGSIRKQDKGNGTAFYNWSASYLDAEAVIKSIYPLLLVKKPEAKVALSLKTGIPHSQLFELSSQIHQQGYTDLSGMKEPTLDYPIRWKPFKYYWDADAVREPISESYANDKRPHGVLRQHFYPNSKYVKAGMMEANEGLFPTGERDTGRNIRSVWTFPTQPYPEAHFAVFPEKLPETCIKAATSEVGCCSKCGAPWERITEKIRAKPQRQNWRSQKDADGRSDYPEAGGWYDAERKTLGWQPTCKCNAPKSQSIVLDPFAGAGTTLWVAKTLGRKAIGFDISEEYCELNRKRNSQQVFDMR